MIDGTLSEAAACGEARMPGADDNRGDLLDDVAPP
jgi:hypothetical protein